MHHQRCSVTLLLAACPLAAAQGTLSVDLLQPSETSGTIPNHFRIVDIHVDVPATVYDYWTAGGIRAITENGASLNYFDNDPNTPGVQPGLFNGGTPNRFYTMLSRPRPRDADRRFMNAGAAAAGAYDPAGPIPVTAPGELNVAYFGSPPKTTQVFDGYVARISVDISGVPPIPGFPLDDYGNWGAGENIPPGALVVLRSLPHSRDFGTVCATFELPKLTGLNWALYYIPEPATAAALAIRGLAILRRRRTGPGASSTS